MYYVYSEVLSLIDWVLTTCFIVNLLDCYLNISFSILLSYWGTKSKTYITWSIL